MEEPKPPIRSKDVDLMSLYGVIKPRGKGVSVEDMNEAIRRAAGRVPAP